MDIVGADCCCFALCLYMGVPLSPIPLALSLASSSFLSLFFLFIHPVAEAVEQPMD